MTATNPETPASIDEEPFGQAGILQHMGKVVNALAVTGLMIACAMWYRSTIYADSFNWRGGNEEIQISSIAGRIKVTGDTFSNRTNNNSGWGYRGRAFATVQDNWNDSIWKIIGIEYASEPTGGGTTGFWLRIKWYSIAILLGIVPVMSLLLKVKRWRDESE